MNLGHQATPPGVLGNEPEAVIFDGETWKIACSCGWECWGVELEEEAWEAFNDHVFDDVNLALRGMRAKARVMRL